MTCHGCVITVVRMTDAVLRWRATLRGQLLAARKIRDTVRTAALRSALTAIDNAETPDIVVPRAGAITDSAGGLGAAEVARRNLTDADIRAALQAEIDERDAAATALHAAGQPDRVEQVRAESAVLTELLNIVGPS